jgi:hypothetical protein
MIISSRTVGRWVIRALLPISAICLAVLIRGFYPGRRVELTSKDSKNRLFAHAPPSRDGTLLVKISDWPFTLMAPMTLGESNWPEKYASSEFYWSTDGSLIVWRVRGVSEQVEHNEAAYDFRHHVRFNWSQVWMKDDQHDQRLDALLKERGGLESVPVDVPGLNSGMFE